MRDKRVIFITRTAILLALTMVVQMVGLPQPVTGPLVNFFLIISVYFVGIWGGVSIGALTPLIAFGRGILPPALAGMVPFIMVANVALVVVFGVLKKYNNYLAVISAAVLKFVILSSAVQFIIQVKPAIAKAMGTPQLINALIGGIAALIVVEVMIRTKVFEQLKG